VMNNDSVSPPSTGGAIASGEARSGRIVTIDWCEVSAKELEVDELFRLLEKHLGSPWGRVYAEVRRDDEKCFQAACALDVLVRADRRGQRNRDGLRQPWSGIRLSGKACQAVGTQRVMELVSAMGQFGALKVSRLDLAMDDFDKTFSPRQFAEACVDGRLDDESALLGPQVVSKVRGDSWEWSRRKGGCFWLGARKSARLLRVYDKDSESGGRVRSTRVELQCRDRFATELMARLHAVPRQGRSIAEIFAEHVVDFVDLRHANGHRSRSQKWERLSWWKTVVGDMKGVGTPGRDISQVRFWVEALSRQCAGFLAVMLRSVGVDAKRYALGLTDGKAAQRIASAVRLVVGRALPELTGDQEARLEQLLRQNGARLSRRRL
jgi:hypothetical protein